MELHNRLGVHAQQQLAKALPLFLIVLLVCTLFPFPHVHAQDEKPQITRVAENWENWLKDILVWELEYSTVSSIWQPSKDVLVDYRVVNATSLKFTVNFTTKDTAEYRVNAYINNVLNGSALRDSYLLHLFDGDVVFDWSDTNSLGYERNADLTGATNTEKIFQWAITTPTLSSAEDVSIDPSITRVQGNARGTSSYSSSVSCTQGDTPTEGNLNIAVIGLDSYSADVVAVTSITQTNVVWTYQIRMAIGGGTTGQDVEIWAGVVGASAGTGITANLNSSQNNGAIIDVCEYSGLETSGFLDKTATNSGTGTSSDTGTTDATTQNDELWIGGIEERGGAAQSNPTNGFTLLDGQVSGPSSTVAFLEKIVSSTGTANSGTTIASSQAWVGCIATFKASGGATEFTYELTETAALTASLYLGIEMIHLGTETAAATESLLLGRENAYTSSETAGASDLYRILRELAFLPDSTTTVSAVLEKDLEGGFVIIEISETALATASIIFSREILLGLTGITITVASSEIGKEVTSVTVEISETGTFSATLYFSTETISFTLTDVFGIAALALILALVAFVLVLVKRRNE